MLNKILFTFPIQAGKNGLRGANVHVSVAKEHRHDTENVEKWRDIMNAMVQRNRKEIAILSLVQVRGPYSLLEIDIYHMLGCLE